jgi:hypothetical protein
MAPAKDAVVLLEAVVPRPQADKTGHAANRNNNHGPDDAT